MNDHLAGAKLIKYLAIFVLVSCIQGSLRDFFAYKYSFINYPKGEQVSFRSIYVQRYDPPYRKILKLVGTSPACSIVIFKPLSRDCLYCYQGDNTQNSVKLYPNERTPVNNYEQFRAILDNIKPKYVMVPVLFDGYIKIYLEQHRIPTTRYIIYDGSGCVFYQLS